MNLYENIKLLREFRGMSQEELAKEAGFKSRSSINKIELGKNDIPQSKLAAIANALRVSPVDLLDDNFSPVKDKDSHLSATLNYHPALTSKEKDLLDKYARLTDKQQDALSTLIDTIIDR